MTSSVVDSVYLSGSTYGAPIPLGIGTVRIEGQRIHTGPLIVEETVSVSSGGGGKGGGGPSGGSTTTRAYYANFAVMFAQGPAVALLRLWAGGTVIMDRTGVQEHVQMSGLTYRFYAGTEDQPPDPLLQSITEGGEVPAYRGTVYVVFERLPLAPFSDQVPSITAEIAFAEMDNKPSRALVPLGGGGSEVQIEILAVDLTRGYGYSVSSTPSHLHRWRLSDMVEDRVVGVGDIVAHPDYAWLGVVHCGQDGALYTVTGLGNTRPIIKLDPDTLREVARFGISSSQSANTTTSFAWAKHITSVSAPSWYGLAEHVVVAGFTSIGVLDDALRYVWGAGEGVSGGMIYGLVRGGTSRGWGDAWVVSASPYQVSRGTVTLSRVRITLDGVSLSVQKVWRPEDFESGASVFVRVPSGLVYDQTDGGILVYLTATEGTSWLVKWSPDLGQVWAVETGHPAPVRPAGGALERDRLTLVVPAGNGRVVQYATHSGARVYDEVWDVTSNPGAQYYDAGTDTLLYYGFDGWTRLYVGRGAAGSGNLADTVAYLCVQAGLTEDMIDVADLVGDIPGGLIDAHGQTVARVLEVLSRAFGFSCAEGEFRLIFKHISATAPVATLAHGPVRSDLCWLDEDVGEVLRITDKDEREVPREVIVAHLDPERDYQQGSQPARRSRAPVPLTDAAGTETVDLAWLAITATQAKRAAQRLLRARWVELWTYAWRTPWSFLALDPLDVVEITTAQGGRHLVRIEQCEEGADLTLAFQGVAAAPASWRSAPAEGVSVPSYTDAPAIIYTPSGESSGGEGSGGGSEMLAPPSATRMVVLDVPLLRDEDATAGAAIRSYVAVAPLHATRPWRGCVVSSSPDGMAWTARAEPLLSCAIGTTVTALGPPVSPWTTDAVNTLTVAMMRGGDRLESVSREEMLAGANPLAVVRADGGVEVIQFRDVVLNGDGTHTLSGLLRGRRGTDAWCTGHQAGETVVLLEPERLRGVMVPLTAAGEAHRWRAITHGLTALDALPATVTLHGYDLMPRRPVHLAGSRAGDGSLTLTWVRQARIGGDEVLRDDGPDTVPLGEAGESYEVDILDAPGGTVARTIAGLAGPTAIYGATDQVADFGAVQGVVHVAVHQMSASIGRGLPATASL